MSGETAPRKIGPGYASNPNVGPFRPMIGNFGLQLRAEHKSPETITECTRPGRSPFPASLDRAGPGSAGQGETPGVGSPPDTALRPPGWPAGSGHRSRRRLGRLSRAPAPLTPGWPSGADRLGRRQRRAAGKPGEVTEPRRI
jgi:hypothetical protein